jgi:hypothetical protein
MTREHMSHRGSSSSSSSSSIIIIITWHQPQPREAVHFHLWLWRHAATKSIQQTVQNLKTVLGQTPSLR